MNRSSRLLVLLAALAAFAHAGTSLVSINPPYIQAGGPDVTISIGGSGFVPGGTVILGGTSLATTYIDSTRISAVVPASFSALSGYWEVFVRNPDNSASSTLYFDIQPVLISVTPNSAMVGPSAAVTVTGIGFVAGTSLSFVTAFASSPIFSTTTNSTTITAFLGAAQLATPGTAKIQVSDNAFPNTSTLLFTITAQTALPAMLTSLNPSSIVAGGPDMTIQINGSGFANGCTARWNVTPLATTLINAGQLSVQIPASLTTTPGSYSISVVNPGAPASAAIAFTVEPAQIASIASISPSAAIAAGPGFTLTVNGSSFAPGAVVQWNGIALATTYVSHSQLTAQVLASLIAAASSANVTVLNPNSIPSPAAVFTVSAPAPATLSSLNPSSVLAGNSGFTLTVNGSDFTYGMVVTWNGASLATTLVSASQLTAQVPANLLVTAANVAIVVTANGSAPSNSLPFTISPAPAPTLTAISPSSLIAGSPGFTLTVTGTGFVASSLIEWNGSPLATTFLSSTQLTAQVLAGMITTAGTVTVKVVNPSAFFSNGLTFTISGPAPTITSISPTSAAAGGPGFNLTVNGSGFGYSAGVEWNGTGLTTIFVSSTQLTAWVPGPFVPGAASITVVNPGGTPSNAATFTITAAPPSLGSQSPSTATAGSPTFSLTINGSGFVSGATVQWNGSPLATTFVSTTQLTVQVPASDVATAATANVTVLNPGSGPSNSLAFTINAAPVTLPVVQRVLNAASYTAALAPGTWAAIFGTRLAVSTASAQSVPLPLTMAEVRSVTVGSVPAPLSYVSPGQINFVVPFEAAPGASVPVVVTTSDGASTPLNITLARSAPALFTQNAQGTGMALALNGRFQPITSVGSDAIILYAVGLGPTNPPPASSAQGGAPAEPLNRVADQVQVFIGEVPCQVQFAGLAPGFPGIYQLNVVPPASPASNRLYLAENGATSNVTTLPIPVGTNVTNVLGSIDGLYPASGMYAVQSGNKPTAGPVSFSEMLNAAAASVSFDIRSNAQPFTVMAVGPGAAAVVQIDPGGGMWQGYVTSPTQVARAGDFSQYSIVVYDLLSGTPFPGNIIPVSRFDPVAAQAAGFLPFPNTFPSTPSPNATFVYASRPLRQSGHFSIGNGQASDDLSGLFFGGFVNIGQSPPSTQTAEFLLFVDGMLVATKDVAYPVQ